MNKPLLIAAFALFLVVLSSTLDARAGSLVTDADCPGRVCNLSIATPTGVTINVVWQADTGNFGFVDVFLDWRVLGSDPDGAIAGASVSSQPFVPGQFVVSATGLDSSVPHTASFTISYSSQLRPQSDPQGINCGTSGLCTDLFGAVTYTVEVDVFPVPVGEGSCVGLDACFQGPSTLGAGSCVGTNACFQASSALIDSGSCKGEAACFQASAEIGDNSCNGPRACYQATGAIGDCSNNTVFVAACDPVVTFGTYSMGDGVDLFPNVDRKDFGSDGFLLGGRVHSPSGAPDMYFRAGSTPTFPGPLDDFVSWAFPGFEIEPGVWIPNPGEGAVDGSDNWSKVIRDGDGAVSWARSVFDFSPGNASDSMLVDIPLYVSFPDGRDFDLAQAVAALPQVTYGTGLLGDGVSLSISRNTIGSGGEGTLEGGRVQSPVGGPNLFFRANSQPTFPGGLFVDLVWAIVEDIYLVPWLGAVDGSDNWIKLIRDGDGAVSWAQCVFDFSSNNASDPILLDIPLYVSVPDGGDFPLAQAIEAVPEPGFALLLGMGVAGLGVVGRRKAP